MPRGCDARVRHDQDSFRAKLTRQFARALDAVHTEDEPRVRLKVEGRGA
jgi:hypothetical protein